MQRDEQICAELGINQALFTAYYRKYIDTLRPIMQSWKSFFHIEYFGCEYFVN